MKIRYISSAANLKNILAVKNTYFIVNKLISLDGITYSLGEGCAIEFLGGAFIGSDGSTLQLNGGQVIAPAYPIFKNMTVRGFNNSRIEAEWFKEQITNIKDEETVASDEPAHKYINRALEAAQGCPVRVNSTEVTLVGTIRFPKSSPSTLLVPGRLVINPGTWAAEDKDNPVAVEISSNNIHLEINEIRAKKTDSYIGTGIRLSGEVYYTDININRLMDLAKGIDISPGKGEVSAGIQYLNIKFQFIQALKCIYIDIFSNGSKTKANTWISRAFIQGGRVLGKFGLYMEDIPSDSYIEYGQNKINEIHFTNIGFEGLSDTEIRIRNASNLKFDYIRMAEAYPVTAPWIDIDNASNISFIINGDLRADKYKFTESCNKITLQGSSILSTSGWVPSGLNTLLIYAVPESGAATGKRIPIHVATFVPGPYQMTNKITHSSDIQQILPELIPAKNKHAGVKVLSRVMQFKINSDSSLDITGLKDYAPCVFYLMVEGGAKLTLLSKDVSFSQPVDTTYFNLVTSSKLEIKRTGTYHLMWVAAKGVKNIVVLPISK
ncbi:MAG: hypothetical protein NC217_07310 [Muribaculaceae bacterium]|nr:hypothetical protein [Muribaculaceae bacterium]